MSRVIICINNVESFNGTISKELLYNFKQIINDNGCTDVDIDSVRGSYENPPRYFVFADMTEECVDSLITKGIIAESDIYTPEEIYPIINSTINSARLLRRLQPGSIHLYIAYIFVTAVVLIIFRGHF